MRRSTVIILVTMAVAVAASLAAVESFGPTSPTELARAIFIRAVLIACVAALVTAATLAWVDRRALRGRVAVLADAIKRLAAPDGSARLVEQADDELLEIAHAVHVAADTVGRQLGAAAHERARMETILASMLEGVLVVNRDGEVVLANEAARGLLPLDETPVGRRYVELIRQPDIMQQIGSALTGETPNAVEVVFARHAQRTFLARAAPVPASAGTGAVLVLHDITDLRRADRMRRDFVANVSHELRTPLTAIRGYVEALLDEGPHEPQPQRFLEIIGRHAARMERLVQDLLRLARLDAGQEALDLVSCSVDALFAAVIDDLRPSLEHRQQQVEIKVAPAATTLVADPAKVHDVLHNLVENASNYSPERARISLSAEATDDRLVLRVADTGPGISEAHLPRIFERFYRVDKARSREAGGTGLGLSIVRHLVELHGGSVAAANRPSGGALFTVNLPRSRGEGPGARGE
ncbi:MAG: PAS domain-containing protein [Luteitalea sp.]|nr:PAS domain-containing protein [Luteitalea sp.]